MGKSKKRKISSCSVPQGRGRHNGKDSGPNSNDGEDSVKSKNNPLHTEQKLFLSSLTNQEREFYFSSLSPHAITPERRADIWMQQAEIGEGLVNRYAWATPTNECLKIFQEFSPIVEIGSGSNAYWTKYMKQEVGIDVVAYDMNVQEGGKIPSKATDGSREKNRNIKKSIDRDGSLNIVVRKGGPEVLKIPELQNHTLFLCYPDEEDAPLPDDNSHEQEQQSFGWQCLTEYKGTYVIHVGELAILGDATLNMEQSPWGRSSSSEFQQRLASEFHCIAKIQLPNWLHVRDSISVWKRSEICEIVFVGDEDDDDDEEEIMEYRHIPPEEMLPRNVIAPCMEHILAPSFGTKKQKSRPTPTIGKKHTKSSSDEMPSIGTKTDEKKKDQKLFSTGEEAAMCSTESKIEQGAKSYHEIEYETEIQSKKTKRGTRRERQKQKKMLLMQRSSSQSDDDKHKSEEMGKKVRSEYFRIHGKLPP